MRIPRSLILGLSASTAVAVLAACSGTGQQSASLPGQNQTTQSVSRTGMHRPVSAVSVAGIVRQPATGLIFGGGLHDASGTPAGLYVGQFAARTFCTCRTATRE